MIKTVIFDLDGTLVDSEADLAAAVNFALRTIGQPEQTQMKITGFIGNGLRVLMQKVLGHGMEHLYPQAAEAFSSYYMDHCTDRTRLYPGVKDFLEKHRGQMKMGVVTNKHQAFSEKIIHSLGIHPYISIIMGCDAVKKPKPHPDPLLGAIGHMGGEPASSLMVGDGPQDLEAGKAARIKTCVATYGFGFNASLLSMNPDYVIHQFQELDKIVSCPN